MMEQKKTAKKKKNRNYFTKEHENAIVEFARPETTRARKNYLYLNIIAPVFEKLIDKIVLTYKFVSLPNIDLLKEECAVYLSTILSKYDPNRKSSAFSYFTVVVKHWFANKAKQNKKKLEREVDLGQVSKSDEIDFLSIENQYEYTRNYIEFLDALWCEIKEWEKQDLKDNEQRVLKAIKILLKDPDAVEIFNKKAIYFHLREVSGLNTKQVLQALSKFKKSYNEFREYWNEE